MVLSTFKCEILSWNATARLANKLADKIKKDGFRPDIVITIARGGYVPARVICDRLEIYDLASIRISHYEAGSTKLQDARLRVPLSVDIRGMQVLLVDDVDDTGDTLVLALEHLQGFQPATIRTAVLHHKRVSSMLPDYYASTVRKWRWIIYPWAITEDINGFINKMSPKPKTMDEIQAHLVQDYGIKLTIKKIQEIYLSVS